ncbi:MAG: LL-diaminopimelate aminotransferase [bacterium]
MKTAKRLDKVPPYLFAELDKKVEAVRGRGVEIINLSVGDPDLPTPEPIIETLCREVRNPANHRYPSYEGMPAFRESAANWFKRRFGAEVDPKTEVISLIGSKEGIFHTYPAFVQPGDISLVPSPGYPVYKVATILADGTPHFMPLVKKNAFLPDLDDIPPEVLSKARIMFLNYPNNPTAAVASLEFFEKAVQLAKKHDIALCHDCAYSELTYDGYVAPSILQVDGAKSVAAEFHSLSKTFNMTGWRIGFALGNPEIIRALSIVKTNVDSGVFQAIQHAAITAMDKVTDEVEENRKIFQKRRDVLVAGLNSIGWKLKKPKATFYLWAPVPKGYDSIGYCTRVLEETGVVITPGVGFGEHGEGYFRIAFTLDQKKIEEAVELIGKIKL